MTGQRRTNGQAIAPRSLRRSGILSGFASSDQASCALLGSVPSPFRKRDARSPAVVRSLAIQFPTVCYKSKVPKKEPPGLTGRVLQGATEWVLTIVLFTILGVVVSSACYLTIVDELVKTLPAFPGARAGTVGAVLAVALILSQPIGYVSVIYLFGFPLGFALAGHGVGLRRGALHLLAHFGQGVAAECARLAWPGVVALSQQSGGSSGSSALTSLVRRAAPRGPSQALLRWIFVRAKIPELVATSRYLDQVGREPEVAQQRLHDAFARWFERTGHMSRRRVLLALSVPVVLITVLSHFWLPWLGIPA